MKHYGDITKLSGYELPVVDCITGGSPCQDLSVAGKRAGLEGERSGLFMEQIRIVKEMREHDRSSGRAAKFVRPRYLVWENVCGVLSASGGKDFQAVLTEIVRIAEPNAPDVPLFKRWGSSGCLYDDMGSWSIAWRVHDTQFWGATQYVDGRMLLPGTPQRRKRIALVADFGGLCAPEVLFERKGLHWDPQESGETRQGTPTGIEDGFGETSKCLNGWDVQSKHIQPTNGIAESLYAGECRGGGGESYVLSGEVRKAGGGKGILIQQERTGTLSTFNNQSVFYPQMDAVAAFKPLNGSKAHGIGYEKEKAPTLIAGGGGVPAVMKLGVTLLNDQGGSMVSGEDDALVAPTIRAEMHGNVPAVITDGLWKRK